MNHQHRKVLHSLFAHPVSANIDYRQVVSVLRELGAEIDEKAGARIGVKPSPFTTAITACRSTTWSRSVISSSAAASSRRPTRSDRAAALSA